MMVIGVLQEDGVLPLFLYHNLCIVMKKVKYVGSGSGFSDIRYSKNS